MELHYLRLFFSFTLDEEVADRFALFGCRGEFDGAFRRALSCGRGECTGCRNLSSCPYPANFGQALASDPEGVRRHQKPPLPFVFRFPILPAFPNCGSTLECSLTLFGSAGLHAACYIQAVRLLLEGFHCLPGKVEAESPGGGRALVAAGEEPALPILSSLDPAASGPLPPGEIALSFLSPLKLVHDGRLLNSFRFSHLARGLMRRVSSLAYYYDGAESDLDYRWLSQLSEAIETASSDCRFVSWNGRPAGILGSVRFAGDLTPFHLLLQMGEATQLGKGASFGFGAYRIDR